METKLLKTLKANLEVGQTINVMTEDLPRIIEMIPAVGKEGEKGYIGAHEGGISKVELTKPIQAVVVALDVDTGKNVGIQLPDAPKGHRWYDAHECDGKASDKHGWFISFEDVAQANPELLEE